MRRIAPSKNCRKYLALLKFRSSFSEFLTESSELSGKKMRNHGIIDRKAERCCSLLENKGKASIVGNSLLQRPKGNANRPQRVMNYAVCHKYGSGMWCNNFQDISNSSLSANSCGDKWCCKEQLKLYRHGFWRCQDPGTHMRFLSILWVHRR